MWLKLTRCPPPEEDDKGWASLRNLLAASTIKRESKMEILEDYMRELRDVRSQKEELKKEMDDLVKREDYLKSILITRLRAEGVQKVSNDYGTVSIKTEVYPQIKVWEVALSYILENNLTGLLPKKVNSAAWREGYEEQGLDIPGISAFEEDTLSFRRK